MSYIPNQLKWKGVWLSQEYQPGDTARDGEWTGTANKRTSDRIAPQPNGEPFFTLGDTPTWSNTANTSVVYSGHKYVVTGKGWLKSLRVWIPTISATTNYRFVIRDESDPTAPILKIIEEPVLVAGQWAIVALNNFIVIPGSVLFIYIDALNSGSSTNISGGWIHKGDLGTSPTLAPGEWSRRKHDVIYFNKTDSDSVSRAGELLGVVPDSVIQCVQTDDTSNSWTYRTTGVLIDQGTYVEYPVVRIENNGNIGNNKQTTIDMDIPVPLSTDYVSLANHWPTNNPSWATIEGYLAFDGVAQIIAGSAFGVDIEFQPGSVSDDWDFVSVAL